MNKSDFTRLIGAEEESEYTPVGGMLTSGYGFAGYFNSQLNQGMSDTCVLINARLVDLRGPTGTTTQPRIADFSQFIEEIVMQSYESEDGAERPTGDVFGKSIPLAGIPLDQVVVVYPVKRIGSLMQSLQEEQQRMPDFLDFDKKSVVLKMLRTKLW